MILDSKGKLFGKVSIIDILVILIVVGGIAGVVYKYTKSKVATPFTKPDTVQIVLYTEKTPEYAAKAINVGDPIKDRTDNVDLGTVTKVEISESKLYGFNSEGKSVASSQEGFVSVKVTAKVQGVLYKDRLTVGTCDFYVYKNFDTRFGRSSFWAFVTDIKKLEE
jgi:hypothetical protein